MLDKNHNKGKIMKRFFMSSLALSAVIALLGCGGSSDSTPIANIDFDTTSASSGTCDNGEPITSTDANESYFLNITQV